MTETLNPEAPAAPGLEERELRDLGTLDAVPDVSAAVRRTTSSADEVERLRRRVHAMSETIRLTHIASGDSSGEYPAWPGTPSGAGCGPYPRPSLPVNRNDRYYTATVLPAILGAHRFIDLDLFLRLCELDDAEIGGDGDRQWLEFLTGFDLAESVVTAADRQVFPDVPAGDDGLPAPDLVIAGADWLVVVEAALFSRPGPDALAERLRRRLPAVERMRAGLGIDASRVRHGVLLTDPAAAPPDVDFVMTWQQVLDAYDGIGPAYWLAVLARAVSSAGSQR